MESCKRCHQMLRALTQRKAIARIAIDCQILKIEKQRSHSHSNSGDLWQCWQFWQLSMVVTALSRTRRLQPLRYIARAFASENADRSFLTTSSTRFS